MSKREKFGYGLIAFAAVLIVVRIVLLIVDFDLHDFLLLGTPIACIGGSVAFLILPGRAARLARAH